MVTLNIVNVFAEDIVGLSKFYRDVFGFKEIRKYRSPIFRLLDAGKTALGFNAPAAYDLLELRAYKKTAGVKIFINFEARSKRDVDERVAKALKKGARLIKTPYVTNYNFYQAVLFDPEGNVFRVNRVLPKRKS